MKDDSINRQSAVDAVLGVIPYDEYWLEQVNKAIEALPSAQQWIPCSERLPEYDAPALLSTAWGKTEIGWWTQRGWVIVPASYRELKQDAVVAWMPLPKPWEGR